MKLLGIGRLLVVAGLAANFAWSAAGRPTFVAAAHAAPTYPKINASVAGYPGLGGCAIGNSGGPLSGHCVTLIAMFPLPAHAIGQSFAVELLDDDGLDLVASRTLTQRVLVKGKTTKLVFIKLRAGRYGFCKPVSGSSSLGAVCTTPANCLPGNVCEAAAIALPLVLKVTIDGSTLHIPLRCNSSGGGSFKCT